MDQANTSVSALQMNRDLGLSEVAFLSGVGVAGAVALINFMGDVGGFVGSCFVGFITDVASSSRGGLVVLAMVLAAGGVLALFARHETSPRASREGIVEQAVRPES